MVGRAFQPGYDGPRLGETHRPSILRRPSEDERKATYTLIQTFFQEISDEDWHNPSGWEWNVDNLKAAQRMLKEHEMKKFIQQRLRDAQ